MLNKVTIIGRLGRDPELKTLASGQTVVKLSVATSERWKDKEGKWQEKTEWHNINVWGKLGELCGKNLHKGRMVFVEGKLQTRSWEDQNGNKKYMTEIIAEKVIFLEHDTPQEKEQTPKQTITFTYDENQNLTDDLPF
jgi:single-strand DNA-binding protein